MRLPPSVCAPFVVVAVAPPMQAPVTSSLHKHRRVALSTKTQNHHPTLFPSFLLSHNTITLVHPLTTLSFYLVQAIQRQSTPARASSYPHFQLISHTITAKRRVIMRSITSSTAVAAFVASMAAISSAQSSSAGMYTRH